MISCELNGRKYTMDFVTGRALREIDDAANMYMRLVKITQDAVEGRHIEDDTLTVKSAMDVMVKWFCLLFGNQFTPDDVYDYYPADSIMHDISQAIVAVQAQTTDILSQFPTRPTAGTAIQTEA